METIATRASAGAGGAAQGVDANSGMGMLAKKSAMGAGRSDRRTTAIDLSMRRGERKEREGGYREGEGGEPLSRAGVSGVQAERVARTVNVL